MMNPHSFVMVIEQDGSRWYEAAGVDAFITELEGDCTDWEVGAEKFARHAREDYWCLRAACHALSKGDDRYTETAISGIIASLRGIFPCDHKSCIGCYDGECRAAVQNRNADSDPKLIRIICQGSDKI